MRVTRRELEIEKFRYTEERIAFALKQAETGTPMAEVIRRFDGEMVTIVAFFFLMFAIRTTLLRRPG